LEAFLTPKARSSTKRIVLVVAVLAVVILGSVGVYLFLASPTPVFSTSINTSGVAVLQTYNVTVGFPKSQMQVSYELASSLFYSAYLVYNSTNDVINSGGPFTSPGTYISTWFNAPPGVYRITIGWTGTLTAKITVFARGFPYVT